MRHSRTLGAALVTALTLSACGSLVDPLPQGQGFAGGPGQPGLPTDPLAPVDGDTDPLDPTGPGTPGGPGPGATLPTDTGPPIDPTCVAARGTDTGVSRDTIKLGLIASLTGPLPGQFDSAVQAVDSYFKDLNERGGICGRRIQLIIRDDNGDGGRNRTVAEQLARDEKIFAFVGSHSAPDDSGIAKVSVRDKIPDIGFPLTWERTESPYAYGVPGQLQKHLIGDGASGSKWLNAEHNIEQLAIFWLKESEVSILNAWAFQAAMIKSTNGRIRVCHEQASGVLDNNYTNYVVAMKGRCDSEKTAVYSTMENNANIKLATAMRDQNFRPKVFAPTFSSYLPSFIHDARGATEGAFMAMPQIPFERLERPQSEWTPGTFELARYISTLKRFHPSHKPPGSFGAPAWGSAQLFTEAAIGCGENLTRTCLLRQLDSMGPFSANGLLSPTRPGDHHIYTADLVVQVRNGRFVEVRPNDKSGPRQAPDFWGTSNLFNWQKFYCNNKDKFINTAEKDPYIDAC